MSIKDEIADAVRRLQLSTRQFSVVPDREARRLFAAFLARFTGGAGVRWWWERFTDPSSSWCPADGRGFERLIQIVPDPDELLWFVAEDDALEFFPVYETSARAAQQVIGECYGFEYYLIANDLGWLVCENHHNRLIVIGDQVAGRLRAMAS